MANSRVYVKMLSGEHVTTEYGCAQPLKNLKGGMLEYNYLINSDHFRVYENKYRVWVDYLIEMGIPLEIRHGERGNEVTVTDTDYINSKNHLLWIHSLIRMVTEEIDNGGERQFRQFMDKLKELRAMPRLKAYDNYQLFQLTTFFVNSIVDTSPTFTHFVMSNLRSAGLLVAKLSTHDEIVERMRGTDGTLSLNGASAIYVHKLVAANLMKGSTRYDNPLELINVEGSLRNDNVSLDKIFEYLERIKPSIVPTSCIPNTTGQFGTLIPVNMYKITSDNGSKVEVSDTFGRNISLHKKNITQIY